MHLDTRGLLSSAKPAWTTIIGVIADARTESLADAAIPQIYRSVYQRPAKDLAIFLRGQLDPGAISAQVREQVQAVDATLPVFHAETLDEVLSTSLSVRRFSMEMVAFFAATALLLAGLGIYGTISYVVNEQRREIAIRLALGAQRGTILKMVLRRGLGLAAAGAGLGVAGALIVSHLMAGLLFGVSPNDLTTFAGVDRCTDHGRARRQLYPGAARHAPRSNHDSPLRMTLGRYLNAKKANPTSRLCRKYKHLLLLTILWSAALTAAAQSGSIVGTWAFTAADKLLPDGKRTSDSRPSFRPSSSVV